jgi:hypothetical protein
MSDESYWEHEENITAIDMGKTNCVMVSVTTRRGRRYLKTKAKSQRVLTRIAGVRNASIAIAGP